MYCREHKTNNCLECALEKQTKELISGLRLKPKIIIEAEESNKVIGVFVFGIVIGMCILSVVVELMKYL